MSDFDKKTLEYLAELGRIELAESEKSKLLKDLQEILNHFQELEKLDTSNVEPMSGGTFQQNIFREDIKPQTDADHTQTNAEFPRESASSQRKSALVEAFPKKENDFLKIPPVFE